MQPSVSITTRTGKQQPPRWLPAAALGLALLLGGAASPAPAGNEYQQGMRAYQQGEYIPAAHHFYKVLQGSPGDVTVMSWYASALVGAGERDKAIQVYKQIVALAPKSPAAVQAKKIMDQLANAPLAPISSLPQRPADPLLLATYGQVLQDLKTLGGYHTQVLALERGVIAAPDSIQAVKELLTLAYNPKDGTLTAVGVGQGADEKKSIGAAAIDATHWLGVLADWQAGKITTSYADRKSFTGVAKVMAREKLANGRAVIAMVAHVTQGRGQEPAIEPSAIVQPPVPGPTRSK